MRSENYVYFQTNPYIKLYTLCMADIVMLYSSLCRSAGAMAGDSLGPGSALGKRQKTGYSKKKMASKTSRGMVSSLRSPFFSPFLPTFLQLKALGTRKSRAGDFPTWLRRSLRFFASFSQESTLGTTIPPATQANYIQNPGLIAS